MSVQYLLDGYNVINQMPLLVQKKLEDRREAFIRLIERHSPQGSLKNKVTVVFDGKSGVSSPLRAGMVRIIYTSDETADDKIKQLVGQAKNKRDIVVVTNDRAIKYAVRPLGASVMSVEKFLSRMPRDGFPARKTGQKENTESKRIPLSMQQKINVELESIWLKKKKGAQKES